MIEKRFRLEKVLKVKILFLEKEKQKLYKLLNYEQSITNHIAKMKDNIELKKDEKEDQLQKGRYNMLVMYEKFINLLLLEVYDTHKTLEDLKKSVSAQKIKVHNALKDFKMIEKLKENHTKKYEQYIRKRELKEIDELNILREGLVKEQAEI